MLVAAGSLTWIATRQERSSLEAEIERFTISLTKNLAEDAKVPLLDGDALLLETLVEKVKALSEEAHGESGDEERPPHY